MKKLIFLLTSIAMLLGTTAFAKDITVDINGYPVSFDQPPIIQNDRTLVPMRAIFEALGCEVSWDGGEQRIDVWQNGINIMTLYIGSNEMWTSTQNGYTSLDVAPQIINARTLVPVRAISEALLCRVNWDGNTKTVSITFDSVGECEHNNYSITDTSDEFNEYEEIDDTYHYEYDYDKAVCNDCGETIFVLTQTNRKTHSFEYGECKLCGSIQKSTPTPTSAPTAAPRPTETPQTVSVPSGNVSSKISDYVEGAFRHIVVPPGCSINIPNTSNGSLKIQMDGVYNFLERQKSGKIISHAYNKKDKKTSCSISKGSEAVIQNSGTVDMVVSIPADYMQYSETSEKVYETLYLNDGDSVELRGIQSDQPYYSNSNYEAVKYAVKNNEIEACSLNGMNSRVVNEKCTIRLTAKQSLEVYYCPATMTVTRINDTAFREIYVGSGETVRVYATDDSSTYIYTDGKHQYDYVTYKTGGKVSAQRQKSKEKRLNIYKKNYTDFTNVSDETVTIKVPNINLKVENR